MQSAAYSHAGPCGVSPIRNKVRRGGESWVQKRKKSQRGEGGRLKLEIIQAAMRILDRSPASDLSLRMAAGEAGVSPTSAYKHFANASTLMTEVVRECWRQLGEEMVEGARQAEAHGAFAVLAVQMNAFVRYAMERPSRYQLLFAMEPMDFSAAIDLPGPIQPAYRSVYASIERVLAAGGTLPMQDVHYSTLLILSIAHGRIALAHTAPQRPTNCTASVQSFVMEAMERLFRQAASPERP